MMITVLMLLLMLMTEKGSRRKICLSSIFLHQKIRQEGRENICKNTRISLDPLLSSLDDLQQGQN